MGTYVLGPGELSDLVFRMTMPFRGGMAATKDSHCGGLTIAILLIGALYGRADPTGDDELAPAIAREYWRLFVDEFGTTHCGTLREGDPGPEASTRCGCIMVRSSRMLLKFLREVEQDPPTDERLEEWLANEEVGECYGP